jgi:hypothetical protein
MEASRFKRWRKMKQFLVFAQDVPSDQTPEVLLVPLILFLCLLLSIHSSKPKLTLSLELLHYSHSEIFTVLLHYLVLPTDHLE